MPELISRYYVRYSADTDWVEVAKGMYDQAGLVMLAGWEQYPNRYTLTESPKFDYMNFDKYEEVTQDCGC